MEITKQDLAMAVTISAGEVARYISMLEHDEYMARLMDPECADAATVRLPWSGIIGAEMTCVVLNDDTNVIPHVDGAASRTDETGHVYRAPVM